MKKMFGKRMRLDLFRLIRGIRMGDIKTSPRMDSVGELKQTKTFSSDAYLLTKRRVHAVETQKTMVIFESRHARWKAGGPL